MLTPVPLLKLGADAITLSPYLGYDSIAPFLKNPAQGVFAVQNLQPGRGDLQDLPLAGEGRPMRLFEKVAALARNGTSIIISGWWLAPPIRSSPRVRQAAPDMWILAPGVGAQGGDLAAALEAGLRADGLGLLITGFPRSSPAPLDPRQAALDLNQRIAELSAGPGQPLRPGKAAAQVPISR